LFMELSAYTPLSNEKLRINIKIHTLSINNLFLNTLKPRFKRVV
jgi:hypothetical protein